jgi:peptidyl-prolyl cis-trans isomerase C
MPISGEETMTLTVNGVTLPPEAIEREAQRYAEAPDPEAAARRSLAVRALLLQRARELGLAGEYPEPDAEDAIIGRVLDAEVHTPTPGEAECRRYFDMHPDQFNSGELVEARHILFAVTPGTPVAALRARAEAMATELMADPAQFAARAAEFSNCPSGAQGGNLGQFGRGQMVPEFDKAVFGTTSTGVLPGLVQTRYGFHIVLVERRVAGRKLDFEFARAGIAAYLSSRVQERALRQYLRVFAAQAEIEGADLEAAASPLVQ